MIQVPARISAQTISPAERKRLTIAEDSLKRYSQHLVVDSMTSQRMKADSMFTRVFVRSLQIRNSFYYPFDSLKGISRLYAPDSSFRIFTWNIVFDDFYSRQRGAIQLRTADGSLKLIPLRDISEFTDNAMDSARGRGNWIGAIYYNMIMTEYKGKKYYTLFGIDYNNIRSSKKWIEVLTFDQRNEPVFGGQLFSYERDSIRKAPQNRFMLEYKKDARVLVNYVDDVNMILVDHLVSESDEPENKWTMVPDGDNEGFRWENGRWVHLDKAFDFKIDMRGVDPYFGKPPVGEPILDNQGNRDDKKLEEQSQKNQSKEKKRVDDNN